ncbi:prolyl oligopeptidase family serine peptidase [Staphylococcus massiliensis]|uniref:alpha/beta hydrolase family protein n=1 Tax=Staphylococcus massiliensis TaxID=555791 RepID=UPI001EDDD3D9|nr:prolyl oligopeptidase family serine peptidase [Staphylococcus massiliensis]MCG3400779.1 prolyl oligopeptidase family serine peptidase [Staphylococcus massiliensis]
MAFTKYKKMPIALSTHEAYEVTYEVDGFHVKGLLFKPLKEARRIVMYLRGGKGQVGRVRPARMMQFMNASTVVFAPYYRGNNGSEGHDAFAGADLNDVIEAAHILKEMYPETPLHLIGFSRGGIQGLLTFQEVGATSYIIWGGVSDLRLMYEERVDLRGMMRRMIGHPKKQSSVYDEREALNAITQMSPPILIVHGGADEQVGIHQAYHFEKHLKQVGATYDTLYQLEEGHVPRPSALKDVLNYIQDWMAQTESEI